MITVNRQGPETMADNPRPGARQQYVDRPGYAPSSAPIADPRVILARGVVGAGLFLLAVVVYFVWRIPTCWATFYGACATIRRVEPVAFAALLLGLPVLAVLAYGAAWWQRQQNERAIERAHAARMAIEFDRFGNPINAQALVALDSQEHLELMMRQLLLATELKRHTAPYEQLPVGLNSLSGGVIPPPAQIASVAESEPADAPMPMDEWLPRLANAYHLMLAAETGGGKSTLAKTVLHERIRQGDQVVVIDPHGSDWFSLTRHGAGRDYEAVKRALEAVYAEMDRRYRLRDRGARDFRRLTVLVDEVPAIYENAITRETWKLFAKLLGSEARKVAISCVLMTQSPLVQDIGINSSMRRNFSLVALDMPSIITLAQMFRQDKTFIERLRGQRWPAAAAFDGEVHTLDRSRMPTELSDPGGDYEWLPPTQPRYVMPVVASVRPDETLRASVATPTPSAVDGRTDGRIYQQERIRLYLMALAQAGRSRDYARAWARQHGLQFENELWTEVRKEIRH